jgi:hypothetical protein
MQFMKDPRKRRMTAADVMYDEPRGSFRDWLLKQCERQDSVGDLACDIRSDSCLGQKRTPNAILMHRQDHGPLGDAAIDAFKEALREWRKWKRNQA